MLESDLRLPRFARRMARYCAHFLVVSLLALILILTPTSSVPAQSLSELVTLNVSAGYDSYFRPDRWMPLRIHVENQGNAISGRLLVRPETSGAGLVNTFSTAVDLPAGSSQSIFLYVTARSSANLLRVELLTHEGTVVANRDVGVRSILPRDRLYAVVTQSPTGAVDLSAVSVGGHEAFQVNWSLDNLPDKAAALEAVDMMLISDVNTAPLSSAQRRAIREWVNAGGHLIVTGGASWQPTAAGLTDLLPLVPDRAATARDLTPLFRLAGDYNSTPTGDFIRANGDLVDGARVLATLDNNPLLARHELGNGVVDYLAVDPANPLLRDWDALPELWFSLVSSANARPAWSYGFADWRRASTAVEILPGLDLLPAALGLIAFLAVYIFLIGPANYWVLSRINRLEYAWVSIPIFIIIFSAAAWTVGQDLRGSDATLNRLSVVQTWPGSDDARIEQLIGLLAPRRGVYDLRLEDERVLHPFAAEMSQPALMTGRITIPADVQQSSRFAAANFPVDASFIAGFTTSGRVDRPNIGGRLTLTYADSGGMVNALQGSISNNSSFTLHDPIILGRGLVHPLDGPLPPGALRTFNGSELVLGGETTAIPSRLEYAAGDPEASLGTTAFGFRRGSQAYISDAYRSVIELMGEGNYEGVRFSLSLADDRSMQENRRRQAFLEAFIINQFASTGFGNRVFLAGWTDAAPTLETVSGADGFDVDDATLYLIELDVERDRDFNGSVYISHDQFTWTTRTRSTGSDLGPLNLSLAGGSEIVFRFTPLPDAVLSEVGALYSVTEGLRSSIVEEPVELWNWRTQEWEFIGVLNNDEPLTLLEDEAARFIGPNNAVELRLDRTGRTGTAFLERLGVAQRGSF